MLKSIKLLLLLLLFASNSQGQNLQLPNMPDSFEVRLYSTHYVPLIELKNLFSESDFIVNLNELINLEDTFKSYKRLIDKPQNTKTFRNGIDTIGFAINDGFWRYFSLKNNSIYYSGLNSIWGICNSPFNMTMYLDKPVLYIPFGIKTNNSLYDTSIINYPLFRSKSQFVSCDSAKLSGFFYSESQNLKSGRIVFELDTIDVYSNYNYSFDSTIIFHPENKLWHYNRSDQFIGNHSITLFTKTTAFIPLAEISQNYSTLRFMYDKRLRTPTGIKTITQSKANLFPNPVKDVLNIEGIDNTEMLLYDALGRIVWQGENVQQIQMQHLSEGIYHLSIKTDAGFLMKKIVKE